MAATAQGKVSALIEVRDQLAARVSEFANALPSHIKPEYFQRAAVTAVSLNNKLLDVDRRSLINALLRCAQDGLIPDGRQATLVIFKDRERGEVAQYMPMVGGIRKLVQQSGEISRFEQFVAHENDEFEYTLGDRPHIKHIPALAERGAPTFVYSVAEYRDGTLSREVMTVDEIEKTRRASKYPDAGPWKEWWGEMARKTVAKRHAKMLPMSNDAINVFARDDNLSPLTPPDLPTRRPRLVEQLDALSAATETSSPQRKRGRARRAEPEQIDIEQVAPPQEVAEQTEWPDDSEAELAAADFQQGVRDARAGHKACLNTEIRDNPKRHAAWRRGYDSAKAT